MKTADDPARVRRLGAAALAAGQRGEALTRRLSAFSEGEGDRAQVLDTGVLLRAMETRLRALAGPGIDLMIEGPSTETPVRVAFARQSGGTLTLTGAEGEGAEATLTLPGVASDTADAA